MNPSSLDGDIHILDWRGRLLSTDLSGGNGLLLPTVAVVGADFLESDDSNLECDRLPSPVGRQICGSSEPLQGLSLVGKDKLKSPYLPISFKILQYLKFKHFAPSFADTPCPRASCAFGGDIEHWTIEIHVGIYTTMTSRVFCNQNERIRT
jgi:hypothetical protein